ncbi:putative transporter YwfM [Sporosarcina sp. NCCP-2222]|uniref:DMT family transporter n=1 Tax=Sporosarcina sp. NCCP-2222 TaxID=2935073 RepID=UPI0020871D4F|nr:EamA family transporter [Sporosarcina sp. NCCP-2222]GKV56205.1 putative transporter YwfM [Sporosarcina sp. NCCP-2222]
MSQRIAFIIVLLGAMLWGTTGTAQTFMPQTVHPLAVGASRLAVGGFSLLILMIVMRKVHFRTWPWKATLLAALAMAIFQYCFFTSIRLTGIAIGTVVAIGSAPMFSGVVEWLYLKRRPMKVWLMATSFAIVGCVLLFSNKEGVVVNPIGVSLSLCAGLLFAFYTLFNKSVLERADAVPSVAVIFSVSAVMLMPFLFLFETEGLLTASGISTVLYLGLATTSIAYILFSAGLRHIPSSSAVTLSLGEPLTAAILSVVVVGERLDIISWGGIVLLVGGILVLTVSGRRNEKVVESVT